MVDATDNTNSALSPLPTPLSLRSTLLATYRERERESDGGRFLTRRIWRIQVWLGCFDPPLVVFSWKRRCHENTTTFTMSVTVLTSIILQILFHCHFRRIVSFLMAYRSKANNPPWWSYRLCCFEPPSSFFLLFFKENKPSVLARGRHLRWGRVAEDEFAVCPHTRHPRGATISLSLSS